MERRLATLFGINSKAIKALDLVREEMCAEKGFKVEGYRRVTIAKMFNDNVARLVMLVTKKEGVDYKQPEAIKEYLNAISSDMNSAAIKTADRMHNMMTLDEKTFEARYRKAMETKTYYLPFFKQCRYMYPRYENLFYVARAEIEPLIFHIESFHTEIQKQQKELEELRAKLENS